ncbi:MAG: helix-turn-helix domain-containing protein [Thermoproteota archaeon]
MKPGEKLLTARELSQRLGVPVKRIYLMCKRHTIPHYHVEKSIRFSETEIMEWLQSHPHFHPSKPQQTDVEQLKLFEMA